MLAYLLAILVGLASFSFYMAAFFVPEVHRRQDFVWSGLGLFYALVLWNCAGRITGAVLLGQLASVALLGWLGWQTLTLRRDLTPTSVQTPVTWADLQTWADRTLKTARRYLSAPSLGAGVSAIAQDLKAGLVTLSDRIAGPRAPVRGAVDRTPLHQSPAYEFVNETGQRESIPTEAVATALRSPATVSPPSAPAASPAPAAPTMSPAGESEPKAPGSSWADRLGAIAAQGSVIIGWLGELAQQVKPKPKPQRTVIDIPPRPPSIPRSPAPDSVPTPDTSSADGSPATATPETEPEASPASPSAEAPPVSTETDLSADDANWAEAAEPEPPEPTSEEATTEPLAIAPTPSDNDEPQPPTADPDAIAPPVAPPPTDSNWNDDDEDSNWVD